MQFFIIGSASYCRRYCAAYHSCRISAFGSWQTRLVIYTIFSNTAHGSPTFDLSQLQHVVYIKKKLKNFHMHISSKGDVLAN